MRKIILFGFMAFSLNSYAVTGNQLLELLSSEEFGDKTEGLKYIQGVADQHYFQEETKRMALENGLSPDAVLKVCIPSNVTYGQMIDVIKRHLNEHPEDRHYIATQEIYLAYLQAWPCK